MAGGTRMENGSLNLNGRKGNIGINTYISGNQQLNTIGYNNTQRTSYNNTRDTITQLLQNGNNASKRNGYQTGLSFNWSVTKHDEFTAALSYHQSSNINSGFTNQDQSQFGLSNN